MIEQPAVRRDEYPANSHGKRWLGGLAAGCLLAAIIFTYPLILHLGSSTPSYHGDASIATYILTWDAHALAHSPTRLFQAPIFYPTSDALAYTDHMLPLGILGAPIYWSTGNPYLAHNVVLILSIAFSGFAAGLLAFELTGDRRVAFIGAALYAFSPYWFGHVINLAHVEILATGWIPLCFFALLRWIRLDKVRWLALGAASFSLAALSSWYQGIFLGLGLVFITPILIVKARRRLARFTLQALVAALACVVILTPFIRPYLHVQHRDPNYSRTISQVSAYEARPTSFLAAPSHNVIWGSATDGFRNRQQGLEAFLFPGATCLALFLIGLIAAARSAEHRLKIIMGMILALIGALLSLGTHAIAGFSLFGFLFKHIGFVRALRVAPRAQMITLVGLSVVGSIGAKFLLDRMRRGASILVAVLVAAILAEGLSIPIELGRPVTTPMAYSILAHRPGAVLELPTGCVEGGAWYPSAYDLEYMMDQFKHWTPLVNGVSGYTPSSWRSLLNTALALPTRDAFLTLQRMRIDTLVLHEDSVRSTVWWNLRQRLAAVPGIRVLAVSGPIVFYALDRVRTNQRTWPAELATAPDASSRYLRCSSARYIRPLKAA